MQSREGRRISAKGTLKTVMNDCIRTVENLCLCFPLNGSPLDSRNQHGVLHGKHHSSSNAHPGISAHRAPSARYLGIEVDDALEMAARLSMLGSSGLQQAMQTLAWLGLAWLGGHRCALLKTDGGVGKISQDQAGGLRFAI